MQFYRWYPMTLFPVTNRPTPVCNSGSAHHRNWPWNIGREWVEASDSNVSCRLDSLQSAESMVFCCNAIRILYRDLLGNEFQWDEILCHCFRPRASENKFWRARRGNWKAPTHGMQKLHKSEDRGWEQPVLVLKSPFASRIPFIFRELYICIARIDSAKQ